MSSQHAFAALYGASALSLYEAQDSMEYGEPSADMWRWVNWDLCEKPASGAHVPIPSSPTIGGQNFFHSLKAAVDDVLPPLSPSPAWVLPATPEASTSAIPTTVFPMLTTPHLPLAQGVFDEFMGMGLCGGMVEDSQTTRDTSALALLKDPLRPPSPWSDSTGSTSTTSSSLSYVVMTPPFSPSPTPFPSSFPSSSSSSSPPSNKHPPSPTAASDTTPIVLSGRSKVGRVKTAHSKRPRPHNTAKRTSQGSSRRPRNAQFGERPKDIASCINVQTMFCLLCKERKANRLPDLLRHVKSHYRIVADCTLACLGVPYDPTNESHKCLVGNDPLVIRDIVMVGGCGQDFSRKDAYKRHVTGTLEKPPRCLGREAHLQSVSGEEKRTLEAWRWRRANLSERIVS
ncbi:hypothetical protein C8T65DRAFT_738502 [Cerioporus squamosus]|nr:hypothetical protein C8T65DRAFT_738502 [Cerioporus squamosus]